MIRHTRTQRSFRWLTILFLFGLLPLALASLPPVNQQTVCLECHSEFSTILSLPNVHAPLGEGKCSACHNPHASKHAGLLEDREAEVCIHCHDEAAKWSTSKTIHKPVSEGKCTACHDPHASREKQLLKFEFKELCASCHSDVKVWESRAAVHDPVRRGQCTRCHPAHASSEPQLLTANQATICLGCHKSTPTFTSKHKGFDPKSSKCSACHDPHSSDDPSLLMPEVHAPFAEGNCDVCHVAKSSGSGYPLRGTILDICGSCHSEVASMIRRYSPHGGDDSSSCGRCHNPHASHDVNLLVTSQRQLCLGCHDLSKGVQSPDEDPHASRACATCHASHGSEEPFYLRREPMRLCGSCHTNQHHVSHPMGDGVTDPQTGNMLTCLSCHQLHGWPASPLLIADGSRDLCVRCHREK